MYEDSDENTRLILYFIFQERVTQVVGEEDGGLTNRIVRLREKIVRNYVALLNCFITTNNVKLPFFPLSFKYTCISKNFSFFLSIVQF